MSQLPTVANRVLPAPRFPLAIEPAYPPGGPSEAVLLYRGEMELEQAPGRCLRGPGEIRFEWAPTPSVVFEFGECQHQVLFDVGEDASLKTADGGHSLDARIRHVMMAMSRHGLFSQRPRGNVWPRNGSGGGAALTHVIFHLPNFLSVRGEVIARPGGGVEVGRNVLVGDGWKVTLDVVDRPAEVREAAKEQGGYLITHVGRVEKEDGSTFAPEDGEQVLEGLGWFLSFACGRWTNPILPVGFDSGGNRVWDQWAPTRVAPWHFVLRWVDDHHGDHLTGAFPGFMRRWQDEGWREVVQIAVHWYVEANAQAGSTEGSIVLTQTAFEMLAAAVIVEENGWVSTDGWEKLPAADRIRLLFGWAGLPLEILAHQSDLTALAAELNWKDAPQAMTEMRNPLTHPTPKNRRRMRGYPIAAQSDAWNLGLWFLELCLLRLCDYWGTYGCRLVDRYAGQVVPVPWAPPAAGPRNSAVERQRPRTDADGWGAAPVTA